MANTTIIAKELKRRLSGFDFTSAVANSDNEAKTRMYLIEEFFLILGYNRGFENGNLVPEFDADFANLKGKKVDYAIQFRSKPEIIVEVKKAGLKLNDKHLSQLNEYFNNTNDSKIGILTNGIDWQFYCRNKNSHSGLHPTPFYTFNFENIEANSLDQLALFHATVIEVNSIIEAAQELFFIESFETALFKELSSPSKDFLKAVYSNMGGNRLTETIEKQIKGLISSVSLKAVLDRLMVEEASNANSGIITTDEELKVFHVVKTILAQHKKIDTNSVGYRDFKGKFSVLMEDNQKKKVCDLYVTANSKRIEIDGEKFDIPDFDSIVKLKKQLIEKALSYVE